MGKHAATRATIVACHECGRFHEVSGKKNIRATCPFCGMVSQYNGKPKKFR